MAIVGQFSFGIFFGPSFCLGFYLFSMDSAPVCVKFTDTNYSTWAFQFELFLKGKDLWGHIDGTDVEKPSIFDKFQDVGSSPSWVVLDARIMSWLFGSIVPLIVTHLRPHRSAQSMWAYLKKVYHQDNDTRCFQLEHAIAMFQHDVPIATLSTIQTIHATTRRDQFLMKLRPEYESIRSSLLNKSHVPSLDICFGELLRKEQRLSTQAILEQSHGSSGTTTVAYAAQGHGPPMHSKNLLCFCCKEYGHIAATCPKKFCSYCKQKGHIIKECRIRPQNRQTQALQTSIIVPPVATYAAHDSPSAACSVLVPLVPDYCIPEMVQRMLISALLAMGFQGNNSTKLWYVDSGASNHMTNNPTALCHVRPYVGQSSIQIANGSSLPITVIGDASSKFTDVFLAPQLSTNLISDQVTGELIAKGPKVGCLFPLFLPVPDFSPLSSIKSFACNNVADLSMVWHRRLGHPNTKILSHVLNSDLLGNKDRSSLSLKCDSCKLSKSKTLHFPLHTSRASHCFDLIHSDVWGPSSVSSHEKFKYYVTFIDDHSRFTWVYFLRSKSEVFRTFTEFLVYVDNQFSTSIKTLHTDSGGEHLSTKFQAFLASKALAAALSNFDIPTCYSHAAKHDCWRQAMQEEIATLQANHTWDIEPCPPTIVHLGCKWVYSSKVRSDGSLDRYKARLVALGNNQEYGVNYEEAFAPMAKMTTVCTILAIAVSNDWPLHRMDVKNAFFHGDLKECIYMKPPPRLFPSPTSHVCKLRRSLYSLKQALRTWFDKFRTTLLQFSFRQSKYDISLFLHKSDMGIVVLLVYVDDIVITGSDSALLGQLKTYLSESFHMKDLGSLTYFLGLETPRHLHLVAVRRIIRYVEGTSTCGLFFPTGNYTRLAAYSDADWAGCADTLRFITGWCVFLGDALIYWKSKKQDRVSKSSTEFEYRVMSLACSKIIWLRGLLAELDFSETNPTPLYADNTSAIQITANPVYHERIKHIEVDCHSICEAFEAHVITLPHIFTDLQIANLFTKALPRHRHCLLSSKLMLVDQPASI
uniref:Retrovirus-related Pol polyprotein from transposon RE1 n=1 Tax=Vitis vinifera TaxID=29760 RepID=A5B6R4_VITVI|nr:hypothetical protein VITISV_036279 [Vitis vinifera]